jgi:hypothetical protein
MSDAPWMLVAALLQVSPRVCHIRMAKQLRQCRLKTGDRRSQGTISIRLVAIHSSVASQQLPRLLVLDVNGLHQLQRAAAAPHSRVQLAMITEALRHSSNSHMHKPQTVHETWPLVMHRPKRQAMVVRVHLRHKCSSSMRSVLRIREALSRQLPGLELHRLRRLQLLPPQRRRHLQVHLRRLGASPASGGSRSSIAGDASKL